MMLDLTVIILTFNEERHIARAIESVQPIAREIIVVDSFSTDKTCEIAESLGARVFSHPWPGNQAAQFNWALDNLEITSEWIFRLDADEYITENLKNELCVKLQALPLTVSAIVLPLGHAFMGKILKHGINNSIKMIRIFRNGTARYEVRMMDEHLSILSGHTIEFKGKFIDDNLMPMSYFISKHNNYSSRQAVLEIQSLLGIECCEQNNNYAKVIKKKRRQKAKYSKFPLFWRSFAYFCYRYFLKLGFLDGKEGFIWDFMHAFWYRTLVDAKIYEIRKNCGDDKDKIKAYLSKEYNIKI